MKRALAALAVIGFASSARADGFPLDARVPLRLGAGYDGQLRAGGLAGIGGVEMDVARLGRGTRLVLGLDFDLLQRIDVPSTDPNQMKLRLGLGVGLIVRPTHGWALVVEEGGAMVLMPSPDDPGATNVVGGAFSTTAYLYPWYVASDQPAEDFSRSWGRALLTGVALFARGVVDWTDRGHGGEVALGLSIDVFRFLLAPVASTVAHTPSR